MIKTLIHYRIGVQLASGMREYTRLDVNYDGQGVKSGFYPRNYSTLNHGM